MTDQRPSNSDTPPNEILAQHAHQTPSGQLYRRLLGYLKPYRNTVILGLIALILLALTEPLLPALMQPLVDETFIHHDPDSMIWVPIAIVIIFIARGITGYVSEISMQWVANKVIADIRQQQFAKLITLPTTFYDHNPTGNTLSKVTYDVQNLASAVTDAWVTLIKDSLIVLGLLAYLLWISWQLALILLLVIPLVAAIIKLVSRRMRMSSHEVQQAMGNATHILEEAIEGQKELKIYGAQAYESGRFFDTINHLRQQTMKVFMASSAYTPVVQLFIAIAMALIVYFAAHQSAAGLLSAGEFVAFFTAMGMLFAPVKRLTKVNESIQRGLAAAQSVFSLLDLPSEKEINNPAPTLTTMDTTDITLQFQQVQLQYEGCDTPAIHQFDFTFKPNHSYALVGSSGSGKTSLANLIPAFYAPTDGKITLNNIPLTDIPLQELRAHIAYVSQHIVLFNDTLSHNITYGQDDVPEAKIIQALQDANAWEFVQKLPQGLHTLIGENGTRLSGGQRQRLAIARAFLKNAPILILDEATSALDNQSEQQVQQAMERLANNRTLIVIAHRLSTIENMDQILVLEQGRLIETGSHTQLMAKNGAYTKLYQLTQTH